MLPLDRLLWLKGESAILTSVGAGTSEVGILRSPWENALSELVSASSQSLLLASPFISRSVMHWIGEKLAEGGAPDDLQIVCLTNLRVESVLNGSLELEGIAELGRAFKNLRPIHLPCLHAKVFVADENLAIVTSGNLTNGGLRRNYEYGLVVKKPSLVREIRFDLEAYARLGALLTIKEINDLAVEAGKLKSQFQAHERSALKAAGIAFKKDLRRVGDRILSLRAKKPNQAIFKETMEYLLSRGPLKTADLHPLIQRMHPDLCDDSVDRVINGVHFGKRWKHWVRSAQQALKTEGKITNKGETWYSSNMI